MLFSWATALRLLTLAPLILAAPTSQPVKRVPLKPDNDPFYDPPAGYENEAPGAILKTRQVVASFLGILPAANVQTYQLLYRTTAINGTAVAGVTTVFKPLFNPIKDRFISFHTAYDASATICNPSYNYQLFASQVDLISSVEFLLLEAYAASGYIVSSPDYEGPDAAFSAGRLSGMGVLDSMRAVSNFHETLGLTTSTPKIVGTGYSGGAIATGWAASLQPSYAPELPIVGWAQGGTPANLTGTAELIDNTAFSGFLPPSIVGLMKPSAYEATLKPRIEEIITPMGQSKLDFAEENCIANLANFFEQSVKSTDFQSLGDQIFYDPVIGGVLAEQTMGVNANETPTVPVYMYHATKDEIIPYANASTLVNSWCDKGASVNFVTFESGGHATTEVLGFPSAYEFVTNAFAGKVATSGCTASSTLNNTLDPIALGANLEPILTSLIDALANLGEDDSNVKADIGVLNSSVPT